MSDTHIGYVIEQVGFLGWFLDEIVDSKYDGFPKTYRARKALYNGSKSDCVEYKYRHFQALLAKGDYHVYP